MPSDKHVELLSHKGLNEVEGSVVRSANKTEIPSHPSRSGSHPHPLERYISLPAIATFGILVQSSWEFFALTFQNALANGGPASLFYGSIVAAIGVNCVGASLAELASIDPTVGAQYRWSANLAPSHKRFWGLMQGWITIMAWCFTCAAPPFVLANNIISLAEFNYDSYTPQNWHTSLVMVATTLFPLVFNLGFRQVLNMFETLGGLLHFLTYIIILATLIVFGPRDSSIYSKLTQDISGWTNPFMCWNLGLLTASFSFIAFDGVLHMSDEVRNVRTRVPQSIITACMSNAVMQFIFVSVMLLFLGPLDALYDQPLPLIQVLYGATGSKTATNVLIALTSVVVFFAQFNNIASVSRLIWTFARDKGLPFSSTFAYVHPHFKLPLNALILISFIVVLISLIYIASATAFNAITSLIAFGLNVSYFPPIFFMLLRRLRGPPPPYGPFRLGRLGIPLNVMACCYLGYILIWMPFPQELPVTKDNMNYSGPILGGVLLLALGDWFISGKKRFKMPVQHYE